MEIHTTARHFELTPELRAHVEDRLGRVDRFVARPSEVRVILEVEKYRHAAEVTLKVDGRDLVARALSADMYTSVDQAVDKLLEQIKRRREAALARRRRAGKDTGIPLGGEEFGPEYDDDEAEA